MDLSEQLYEQEAVGWQAGLYDDIKTTFRAPVVNWIFRVTMANAPELLRYAWGEVKPVFETRAFAEYTVSYRDTLLSGVTDEFDLRAYRIEQIDLRPSEFRELWGQLETKDIVAPRLAVLFELLDRALSERPIGHAVDERRAATEPHPRWLDRDRGKTLTMIGHDEVPNELQDVISAIKEAHPFSQGMGTIHRVIAQWPSFMRRAWNDIGPLLSTDAYADVRSESEVVTEAFVDSTPYRVRLAPGDLQRAGIDGDTVDGFIDFFDDFKSPARTAIPTLPLYAALADATGRRSL
ncbi:halocarboxylic acid dehydrogenase DehI family protein [Natrinema gelatinilyticum]|uniref:halocarboxylic acid dehydrogenase DehI family protein n=1 Tax=Natrinema gelatinilyticum TaxID=2961571 RepID=UPI0020C56190|nr:halocarboxylic acid dehydrogenase DehI family protein [Natrinema gelatinilyticum]